MEDLEKQHIWIIGFSLSIKKKLSRLSLPQTRVSAVSHRFPAVAACRSKRPSGTFRFPFLLFASSVSLSLVCPRLLRLPELRRRFLFGLDLELSLAYGSGRSVQQRLKTAYAPQRLCVFGIGGALTDKVFQLGAYQVECWSMVVMRSRFVLCQIHWFGCAAVVFDGSFSG